MVQEMMFRRTAITASGRGLAKAALPGSFMAVLFWLFAGLVHPLLANNENLGNQSIGNEIVGLRLGQIEIQQKPGLRLVVEMVRPVKARLLLLDKPWRLVIDAADTDWQADGLLPAGDLDNPPARRYRFGHPEPGIGRLVIELDSPAAPLRAFTLPPRRNRLSGCPGRLAEKPLSGGTGRHSGGREPAISGYRYRGCPARPPGQDQAGRYRDSSPASGALGGSD